MVREMGTSLEGGSVLSLFCLALLWAFVSFPLCDFNLSKNSRPPMWVLDFAISQLVDIRSYMYLHKPSVNKGGKHGEKSA